MNRSTSERLLFIGDVHLEREDADLKSFLRFLDNVGAAGQRIVLMGDLFNLWIGRRGVEQSHHRAVVDKLREIRDRGAVVRYLEGNRDYRVAGEYAGVALDDSGDRGITEAFGGHRVFAIHGDQANPADRNYMRWRRFSRSTLVWMLLGMVPNPVLRALTNRLELRLRRTNLRFKGAFPDSVVRDYAETFFLRGHDVVVLGHFHVEKELRAGTTGAPRTVYVLPEWKGSRRHLELDAEGRIGFVDSRC